METEEQRRHFVVEEFDYLNFKPVVDIQLKSNVVIRSYQEKAVSNVFQNQRVKSGIVVMPCGAGKTLTAICIAV